MLGAALVLGGGQVAADEPSASNNIKVVVTQTADEDAPTKAQEGTKESITTPATEVSATESKTEEVTPEGTSSSTATETTDSSVVVSADTTEETTPSVEESKTEASSDVTEESTAPSVEESKEAETAPSVEENKTENQESTAESKTETSEDKAEEVAPTTATTTSATETTEKEVTATVETTPELTTTVAMPASETSQETTPKITDLTPDEIKVLTTSQLAKMDLSNTILASLTFEQSKALTLNKDYQRLGSGGSVSESGDRFFANVQGGTPVNNVNTFRPSVTYESNQAVSDFVNGTDIQLATPTTGEHSSQTISGSLWHDGGVINTYDKAAAESDQNFGWKPIGNYVQVGTNFWGGKDNSIVRPEKDQNYIILGKYQSGKNNQLVDGYEGVYQDITVAPGGEFVFKTIATLAGSGTTYQTSETSQFGVTIVALDKDGKETETVLFTKTNGYKFDFLDGKYSVMVNVPTTVNKIRVKITPGKSSAFNTSYNSVDTYGLALVSAKDWVGSAITSDYNSAETNKYAIAGDTVVFDNIGIENDGQLKANVTYTVNSEGMTGITLKPTTDGSSSSTSLASKNNTSVSITETVGVNPSRVEEVGAATQTNYNGWYAISGYTPDTDYAYEKDYKFEVETSDTIDKENIYYLKGQLSYYTNHVSQFINIYSIYTEKVATVADKTKDRETVTAKLDPGTLTVYPKATAKTDNVFRVGGTVSEAADMINDKIKAALEDSSATVTYAWKTALSTDAANTYATGVITATYTFPDGTTRTVDVSVEAEVVDVSKLQELVDNAETVRQSPLYTEADDAEKAAYDKSIEEAQTILNDKTSRQTAVDTGVTNITNDAKTGSYDQLNGWTNLNQAKKDALDEVKADAELLQNNIGSGYLGEKLPEASQTKYKDAIQAVVDQLAKDIEAAEGDDLSVETGGAQTIAKVEELKAEANAKIQLINYQAQLEAKKQDIVDKINANTEATDEEKAAVLKLLDAEYNEAAEKLINAAPSSVPETSSENANLKKIVDTSLNDDYLTPERKAAAKQVIEEVYASKQKELQNTPNATQEEIEAALAKLDEEKANTLAAIDAATTNAGVDTARANGVEAILAVEVNPTAKQDAEKAIDDYAAQKIAEYQESLKGLSPDQTPTQDEQDAYIAAVKATAEAEKAKVEAAFANGAHPDADTLSELVTDAKAEIDKVTPENNKKANAISAIEKIAADKLATITAENYPNATEEELQAARDAVNKEKEAAKDAIQKAAELAKSKIDNSDDNSAVDTAKTQGMNAIAEIVGTPTTPENAKNAIDAAAAAKIETINKRTDLTDEEKAEAIAEVEKMATAGKEAFDKATDLDGIAQVQKNTIQDIINYNPESMKEKAKDVIDQAAADRIAEIVADKTATDEEKAAAIQKVQDAAADARKNIDAATDKAGITAAETAGEQAIKDVPFNPTDKADAKKALQDAADAKKEAINAGNMTDEEKAAAIQAVDDALNKATNAIDNTSTIGGVDYYKEAGIDEINKIPTESTKKPAATAEIDKAAEDAKNTVDADSRLTDEEKQAAKEAIDKAAQAAKDAIDKDSIDAQVDADTDAGKKEIESLIPTASAKKDAADAEIDKAAQDAKAEVDNNSYLSDDEKQAAKDAIDKAAQAAKDAIDASTTNAQVDAVTEAGKQAIKDLIPQKQAPSDEPVAPEVPEVPSDSDNSGDGGMVTPEAPSDSDADHSDNAGMEAPKAPATSSSSADAKGTQSSQAPSTANALVVGNGVGSSQATLPKTGQAEDRNLLALGASIILGAFGLLAGRRKREDEE